MLRIGEVHSLSLFGGLTMNEILTKDEVAALLHTSTKTLSRIKLKDPTFPVGASLTLAPNAPILWFKEDILNWLRTKQLQAQRI